MTSKNNSNSQLLGLVLKQIENVTQEIQRTIALMAQALTLSGEHTKDVKELVQKVIEILTNDKDGFRKQLTDVGSYLETYNTFEIEKKKSWWSLRTRIIAAVVAVIISNAITYLITTLN